MKLKIKKYSLIEIILIVLCLIIASWYILPSIKNFLPPRAIAFMGVVLIIIIISKYKYTVFFIKYMLAIFLMSLIYFYHTFPGNIEKSIGIFTQYFVSFLPIVVLLVLIKYKRIMKSVIMISWLMIIFVFIKTFIEVMNNDRIIRMLTSGESDVVDLKYFSLNNIGGFGFVYGMVFVFAGLLYVLVYGKFKKIYIIFPILLLLFFLIEAQFFIALIVSTIGLLLMIFLKLNFQKKIIMLFIILLIIPILPSFLMFLSGLVDNSMGDKLVEFVGIITFSNELGSSTLARLNVYESSLIKFVNNPLIGMSNPSFESIYDISGGHSTVLDTMAMAGIVGLGIYTYMITRVKKIIDDIEIKNFLIVMLLQYILLSILNPILNSFEVGIFAFMVVPATIHLILNKKEEVLPNEISDSR